MSASPIKRLIRQYHALGRVLSPVDFLMLVACTIRHAPEILRTGKLTSVDTSMSRNLAIRYRGHKFSLPLANIDELLAPYYDNPTFGNLREMYADDCYLRFLRVKSTMSTVLDLGANRGLFSLIALLTLGADIVVGVEPQDFYEPVMRLLLDANNCAPRRVIRYNKFIGSTSAEQSKPNQIISIDRIREEQGIARFGLVKIDIEGGERDLFSEPHWLSHVDTIVMELHHRFVGDLTIIPQALEERGFHYVATDQTGKPCRYEDAMFLYASCTGVLADS